jgi:hypothetical protein
MKVTSFAAALIAAAIGMVACCGPASAATLATWTFETSLPATAGPFSPEVGAGSGLGFHASPNTIYSNPVGNGSAESFSSNTWAIGDYYQFSTATAGNSSFTITWDQISSGTGPKDFTIQYSTNGTTFTDINPYTVIVNTGATTWGSAVPIAGSSYTASVNSISASTIYFRMINTTTVSANNGTVAAAGTNRIDNVSISGVPEPTTLGLAACGLIGVVVARRRG